MTVQILSVRPIHTPYNDELVLLGTKSVNGLLQKVATPQEELLDRIQ